MIPLSRVAADHAALFAGRDGIVPLTVAPCVHEGAVLEWCTTCAGESRHVRDCDLHDRCTRATVGPLVRGCDRCGDYSAG